MLQAMADCGCHLNNAYMQHSLLALVVIPDLRISDLGLVDVRKFELVPVVQEGGTRKCMRLILFSPSRMTLPRRVFAQAPEAVAHLIALYEKASEFLCEKFISVLESGDSSTRYRAFYPEVRITTLSYASVDSRLSFGHVYGPGVFATTITQPGLFQNYLEQQLELLIANHGCAVQVGYSTTPIPVHFARGA